MTGITNIRRWNMTGTLTTGDSTIMTIKTGTDDLRMIDRNGRYWCPGCREFLVTGITDIATGNMIS